METELTELIEKAIRGENQNSVPRMLHRLVKKSSDSRDAVFRAAVYHQRMGDYKKAINLLGSELNFNRWNTFNQQDLDHQIRLVVLLSMMGSNQLAVNLADRLPVSNHSAHLFKVGLAYLHCHDFEKALSHFEKCFSWKKENPNMDELNGLSAMAVSFIFLKNFEKAEKCLKKLLTLSEDRLLQNISRLWLGITYVRSNRIDEALPLLDAAREFFERSKFRTELGNTLQYLGACYSFQGRYDAADEMLGKAFDCCYIRGANPAAWLGVLYYQGLNLKRQTGKIPEEWVRISLYPSSAKPKCPEMVGEDFAISSDQLMSVNQRVSRPGKKLHYDIPAQTKIEGSTSGLEKHTQGLQLLDRALITLILAGKHGISDFAFYDAMWGSDVSITQCHRRITQLIMRLRRKGFEIKWEAGQLHLHSDDEVTCFWSVERKVKKPVFLEKNTVFSRKDVEAFFSISKSQALIMCANWLEDNLITRDFSGAMTAYKVL